MQQEKNTRGLRKERIGIVTSDVQNKTLVVRVERKSQHPRYKKIVSKAKKYYVHDEKNDAKKGDTVRIAEMRPMSKLKRWRLLEITNRGE